METTCERAPTTLYRQQHTQHVRCANGGATHQEVVGACCGRNLQVNYRPGGCYGGSAERCGRSGDMATTACLPTEAVFQPKPQPLPFAYYFPASPGAPQSYQFSVGSAYSIAPTRSA